MRKIQKGKANLYFQLQKNRQAAFAQPGEFGRNALYNQAVYGLIGTGTACVVAPGCCRTYGAGVGAGIEFDGGFPIGTG